MDVHHGNDQYFYTYSYLYLLFLFSKNIIEWKIITLALLRYVLNGLPKGVRIVDTMTGTEANKSITQSQIWVCMKRELNLILKHANTHDGLHALGNMAQAQSETDILVSQLLSSSFNPKQPPNDHFSF